MNKFIRIENGAAVFSFGAVSEKFCRERLEAYQAAIEAFRVEKLVAVVRSLDNGLVQRADGSYLTRLHSVAVIFTPNSAGDCFVEQGEKRVVISLDEPLEVLIREVKSFIWGCKYRKLEAGEIIQEGDEVSVANCWEPYLSCAFGTEVQYESRRPLLPNSITSKNFTLSNNTNQ